MEKSVQFAAFRRQVAPPAFTDYWTPMNGKVGAACRSPTASCTSGVYGLLGIGMMPLIVLKVPLISRLIKNSRIDEMEVR